MRAWLGKWALLGLLLSGAAIGFAHDNNGRASQREKAAQKTQRSRTVKHEPRAKSEVRREVKETFRPKKHAKRVWKSK